MSYEVYSSFLDEVEPSKVALRLISWSEPTAHPKWLEFLTEAKRRELLVHLNINGRLFEKPHMESLVTMGVDSIKFSFQGVDKKSYEEMRLRDYFDPLCQKIRLLHEIRGGKDKPFVHTTTTTTYESKQSIKNFRHDIEPYVDELTIGRTVMSNINLEGVKLPKKKMDNLVRLMKEENLDKVHPKCPEVFDKLTLNWDGSVTACCADSNDQMLVGDIGKTTLAEIWKSKRLNGYRKVLANDGHNQLPVCKTCWIYINNVNEEQ